MYRLLCGRRVSEKLPKIPLFGHSLILQLRLLDLRNIRRAGSI